MKKLLVLTTVAATMSAAQAFDYKWNLEGRADMVSSTNKESVVAGAYTATDKFMGFNGGIIRLNTAGNFNESLSYRFRYRFATGAGSALPATPITATTSTTSAAANGAAMNYREALIPTTGNGIDFMYVDHKNSMFTTRWGKFYDVQWSGREAFVAGSDVFATTQAVANFRTAIGSEYRYGASARFVMDTNNLVLTLSNPNAKVSDANVAASTSAERKNTGLAMGVYYNGSFMNKMIQPVLAYTTLPQDADTDKATASTDTLKYNDTMMAVGLRSEVAGAVIDADYKEFTKENANGTAGALSNEQKTKSVYVNVAYPIGDLTPVIAYISDKYTDKSSATQVNDYKKTSFVVAALWKPFSDANFRYHAAYTSAETKYDAAAATYSKLSFSSITLGIKFDI